MTAKIDAKATWPVGAYLIVSVCGAFVMSMPGLDCIPARPLMIQAVTFLVMMWSRLAWAVWNKEGRESYSLYITLMIILPFVMRFLGDMLLPVYDLIVRLKG